METVSPHYAALHLVELPDIVKLKTCLLFYDYLRVDKLLSFPLILSCEQHS